MLLLPLISSTARDVLLSFWPRDFVRYSLLGLTTLWDWCVGDRPSKPHLWFAGHVGSWLIKWEGLPFRICPNHLWRRILDFLTRWLREVIRGLSSSWIVLSVKWYNILLLIPFRILITFSFRTHDPQPYCRSGQSRLWPHGVVDSGEERGRSRSGSITSYRISVRSGWSELWCL